MKFRELDTGLLSASENMVLDQALLELQAEDPLPTLRFLSFDPACVLVGYFQEITIGTQLYPLEFRFNFPERQEQTRLPSWKNLELQFDETE